MPTAQSVQDVLIALLEGVPDFEESKFWHFWEQNKWFLAHVESIEFSSELSIPGAEAMWNQVMQRSNRWLLNLLRVLPADKKVPISTLKEQLPHRIRQNSWDCS